MKVSVIIPVYNAFPFLDLSIQSALDQPQTGEVILIDDRSTDRSWEKCEEWVRKDKRVKLFRNEGIKGAGAARNVGLRNATCEYIAFLDADDYYLEVRFEDTERLFVKNKDIDGILESAIVVSKNLNNNKVISGRFINNEILGCKSSYKKLNVIDLFQDTSLLIQAITIKNNILQKSVTFDESLKQTQDTDFILYLIQNYTIISGKYEKPVVAYRFHQNNTTKNYDEAIFYRHLFYRKHVRLCLKGYYQLGLIYYFFKRYVEYTYLITRMSNILPKKIEKMLMMPYFIITLFSDPIVWSKNKS